MLSADIHHHHGVPTTKAETIFWTYFKGNEEEKLAWSLANDQHLSRETCPSDVGETNDSEFRVVDAADIAVSRVIDDMPSHVLVRSDGEADVLWFDGRIQKHVRKNPSDPVSVSYNKFGKVKRKKWIDEDGTVTEREFNM